MHWFTLEIHHYMTLAVLAWSLFMLMVLLFIDAPYGRQDSAQRCKLWGPNVPIRLGWILLELPVFAGFAVFFFAGDHWRNPVPLILASMFLGHYFHRTFIYPLFIIKPKPGAGFRVGILAAGMPLNATNGAINGWFISQFGEHLYQTAWLSDPRFIIGVFVFFFGFYLAKHSDRLLANLRKPGETGYKIPYGGAYRWVSNPHYLGELTQWCGFALACWSLPAFAYAFMTFSNLLPRALSNQRWYQARFDDYPKERKALIPFVI
jgi:3-oxo-5-alpha-steroid 4-dehydrogenase 1